MSHLMSDVLSGNLPPSVCNAAVNAGGKLLKVVEMQNRYGQPSAGGSKELSLCGERIAANPKAARIAQLEQELADLKK